MLLKRIEKQTSQHWKYHDSKEIEDIARREWIAFSTIWNDSEQHILSKFLKNVQMSVIFSVYFFLIPFYSFKCIYYRHEKCGISVAISTSELFLKVLRTTNTTCILSRQLDREVVQSLYVLCMLFLFQWDALFRCKHWLIAAGVGGKLIIEHPVHVIISFNKCLSLPIQYSTD